MEGYEKLPRTTFPGVEPNCRRQLVSPSRWRYNEVRPVVPGSPEQVVATGISLLPPKRRPPKAHRRPTLRLS